MQVNPQEIEKLCHFVHELCGLDVDSSKSYLFETRFARLIKDNGLASFSDLLAKAKGSRVLQQEMINQITTQETLFYRDNSPFEALKHKVIPEAIDANHRAGRTPLRFWSAACSTGQEVYSLSMLLHDMLPDVHRDFDIKIIATDISTEATTKASKGVYSELEVARGLELGLRSKYFTRTEDGWKIDDSVRSLVTFKTLNLLKPFPADLRNFDVVLCRNVAIYFDDVQKKDLFMRIKATLKNTGYLFVGASETLAHYGPDFQPQNHCRATVYRPNMSKVLV